MQNWFTKILIGTLFIIMVCVGCSSQQSSSIGNNSDKVLSQSSDIIDFGNGIYYFNILHTKADFGEQLSTFVDKNDVRIVSIAPYLYDYPQRNSQVVGYYVVTEKLMK